MKKFSFNNFIKTNQKNIFSKNKNITYNRNSNKYNILLFLFPVCILIAVVFFSAFSLLFSGNTEGTVTDELYNKYSNENSFKNRVYGEDQTPNMENQPTPTNEKNPISFFGDSFCISANIQTPSLAAYVSKYTNANLVYNVAEPSDNLELIAARVGAVPMYVSPCDISAKKKNVEITLSNAYGTNIVPGFAKNAGLNPCKINGVEGVIAIENDTLYFSRSESGFESIVTSPAVVTTRAMEMRMDDIAVIMVGNEESYKNIDKNIEICKKIVEKFNSKKYIVVGPVYGNIDNINTINSKLSDAFGNKFLDLYSYLTGDAIAEYSLQNKVSENSTKSKSSLPEVFLSKDKKYFSDIANDIAGKKIAEKLTQLRYL